MNYSEKYRQRGKFWAKALALLPGVKTILLSGSLVQNKAGKDSDIDIFIIAKEGQIWTACFMIKVVLRIFNRLANSEKNHAGKICPNHFITDNSLVIKEQDAYAADLFSRVEFLAGDKCIFQNFVLENEGWIGKFISKDKGRNIPEVELLEQVTLRYWQNVKEVGLRKILKNY